jgi:hypothetical protein
MCGFGSISEITSSARDEYACHFQVPAHFARGCGGCQRRLPIGGARRGSRELTDADPVDAGYHPSRW